MRISGKRERVSLRISGKRENELIKRERDMWISKIKKMTCV